MEITRLFAIVYYYLWRYPYPHFFSTWFFWTHRLLCIAIAASSLILVLLCLLLTYYFAFSFCCCCDLLIVFFPVSAAIDLNSASLVAVSFFTPLISLYVSLFVIVFKCFDVHQTGSSKYNLWTAYNMQYNFSSTLVRNKIPTASPILSDKDIPLMFVRSKYVSGSVKSKMAACKLCAQDSNEIPTAIPMFSRSSYQMDIVT